MDGQDPKVTVHGRVGVDDCGGDDVDLADTTCICTGEEVTVYERIWTGVDINYAAS